MNNLYFLLLTLLSVAQITQASEKTLTQAIHDNDITLIENYLKTGTSANCTINSNPILYYAIEKERPDIAKVLIHNGANINQPTTPGNGGYTPLQAALIMKQYELADFLIDEGAYVNVGKPADRPLALAVSKNQHGLTKKLINKNADINNGTPLRLAVLYNNLEIARLLIDAGVEVNEPGNSEYPLLSAILIDNLPLVQKLLHAGAKTESMLPGQNISAIQIATAYGKMKIAQAIREHEVAALELE